MCHASRPQIQVGAPRMRHLGDWTIRLKQGLDNLLIHTQNGVGAMPPRGGCFECSDSQLKKALQAMLPLHKKTTKNSKSQK
jgi:cytochrome c5